MKVALGFTPVLLEQLQDPYMQTRFLEYLEARMEAARQDVVRFAAAEPKLAALAEGYLGFYGQVARDMGTCSGTWWASCAAFRKKASLSS